MKYIGGWNRNRHNAVAPFHGERGLKYDAQTALPAMAQTLAAGLRKTQGIMRNLTMSTAVSAQDTFIAAADLAYLQVSSGAFSYTDAIRNAVKDVASKGLQTISYASGRRDQLDVAIRRTVLTGVTQTTSELQLARMDELETDLIAVSAHIGARNVGEGPKNHESWQGKIYSKSGKDTQYPNFYQVTGFGTIEGLGGINCVIGDTNVAGFGIRSISRRKYEGEIIVIRTAAGHNLTITPNHPILTEKGWVAAGLLNDGDNLISSSCFRWSSGVCPNNNHIETTIENIFNSFSKVGNIFKLPISAGYFHGDISNSEIDVVFPDSLLNNSVYSTSFEHEVNLPFSKTSKFPNFFTGYCAFDKVSFGSFHTSNSIMGRSNKSQTFRFGHSLKAIFHRFRSIFRDWNTHFCKIFSNCSFRNACNHSDLILPHSVFIHIKNIIRGKVRIPSKEIVEISRCINSIPFQTILNSMQGTPIQIGKLLHSSTAFEEFDNIVFIERKSFTGHVYNLETESGWYFANNIITHNCRHSFYPFIEGVTEKVYSESELKDYESRKVTYNGKEMTVYEASQQQRYIERQIRKWKREAGALEASGLDNEYEKSKVREWQVVMRDFTKQTDLIRQREREQVTAYVPAENVDRDLRLAQEGKLFSFDTSNTDTVLNKPLDYSKIYGNDLLKTDQVIFTPKEKAYIQGGHAEDIEWFTKNQDLVLKVITNPLFIDVIPRLHDKTAFNIAHIVYIGDQDLPFLNVVLSFHKDGRPAKIWTMFRVAKNYIYELTGERKNRWRKP